MTLLSDAEIEKRLATLPGWRQDVSEGPDAPAGIARELKLESFAAAIAFVNRVAELAEEANHHPDIYVYGWNNVRLTLSTHSEGGLTEADFELAARIDQLA
jgi:4a-hydroxytetrahydrobiopterin dehydratase